MLDKTKKQYMEEHKNGEIRTIGYLNLCNYGGIGILDYDFEQIMVYCDNGESKTYHLVKVYFDSNSGDEYFKIKGMKYYLNEFLKMYL